MLLVIVSNVYYLSESLLQLVYKNIRSSHRAYRSQTENNIDTICTRASILFLPIKHVINNNYTANEEISNSFLINHS